MEFIDFIRTPQVEKVKLFQSHVAPVEGTLCVGGHHLILTSPSDQKEHLWVQHKQIYNFTNFAVVIFTVAT